MKNQLESQEIGPGESLALLIVDASKGFTDANSPLGAEYPHELENIARLITHAHSNNWPCFFSTVVYHTKNQASVFRKKIPGLDSLTPESEYIEIDESLPLNKDDRIFEKQHASCFFGTELASWLKETDVDTLVITGFTTSGCVRASAVDALQHNFRTLVVADAVGDRDAEAHTANLKDLQTKYADVVKTNYVLDL